MIYRLSRFLLRLALDGFFRKVSVQGRELIPATGPVLLTSNHTNALVDPLLVATRIRREVTLTAKSTLEDHPLLGLLIRGLGVILFHRRRDTDQGADPEKNPDALARCVDRLRAGGAVYVFPEGVSHSDPDLRPFRTGAARIVQEYLEKEDAPELWIVPVGLHFQAKDRWRSEAVALVGEPVGARDWTRRGAEELTRAMERWIRDSIASFSTTEERELLLVAAELIASTDGPPPPLDGEPAADFRTATRRVHRLQAGANWLSETAPDRFSDLATRTRRFGVKLQRLGITAEELQLPIHWGRAALFVVREGEILVVGLPLVLWGWLNHLPALQLTKAVVRTTSREEDQFASNAVFFSIPIFLLLYLGLGTLALALLPPLWAALYVVSLPFTGAVALRYRDRAGSVVRRVRTFLLFVRRPRIQEELREEAGRLVRDILALDHGVPFDA